MYHLQERTVLIHRLEHYIKVYPWFQPAPTQAALLHTRVMRASHYQTVRTVTNCPVCKVVTSSQPTGTPTHTFAVRNAHLPYQPPWRGTIMHNAHKYNGTTLLIFSAQRCNFVHNDDAEARGVPVTYEPGGCDSIFDTTNCVATYTHLDQSATCSCTRDDITGSIECFSDSVANLTADVPITTTTDSGPLLISLIE